MEAFDTFPNISKQQIKYVLTDIDDTLTLDGNLPAIAHNAMDLSHSNLMRPECGPPLLAQ
jgi:hypothetical protein